MNPNLDGQTGAAVLDAAATGSDLRTILLLDPVALFLKLEETILARRDWRIHAVRSGSQAMEILQREHVDLVVMDHALPDVAGDAFIDQVRANPRTRATGILVLTARGCQAAVERCLDAGANGVLFKPVTRVDLCTRVEDLLYVSARRHVRTMVRLQVAASTGSTPVFGNTVNVSAGGMLLETTTPLSKGDVLDVRFTLPGQADPIVAKARVVREATQSDPSRASVGLSFEGMTDAERARIEEFVSAARPETNAGTQAG